MSQEKENKYRVVSPIKRGGKRFEVGESILLTEADAADLHVEDFDAASAQEEAPKQELVSVSSGVSEALAVNIIKGSTWEETQEFVNPDAEKRKKVIAAYNAKKKEAEAAASKDKS